MLKIKNRTMITIVILSLIIGNIFFIVSGSAAANYSGDATTTSIKEKGKVIFKPNGPFISSLEFSSDIPGAYNYEDFRGNDFVGEDIVPDTEDLELYYPIKQDIINDWNYDTLQELYTYYANVRNNSDDYGEYSVSLNSIPYNLKADGKDVQFYPTDSVSLINLYVSRSGVYQMFLSDLTYNPANVKIFSPSGKVLPLVSAQLPPSSQGGVSLGKYFYFATFESGDHQIYIPTADEVIKLRCESADVKSISLGTLYSEGPDPNSNDFLDPVHTFNVYSLNVRDINKYYKYLFDVEYGNPIIDTFYETPYEVINGGLTQGYNEILDSVSEGNMFIVIDNPNYFSWPYAGISEPDPVKYILKFDEIKPISIPKNGKELVSLSKIQGVTARTVEVEEMSILSLGIVDRGASSPDVYDHGGFGVIARNYKNLLAPSPSIENIDETAGMNYYSALVVPGDYQFAFKHSGTTTSTEYIEYDVEITPLQNFNVVDLGLDSVLMPENLSSQFIYNWSDVPDTLTTGVGYGVGWTFEAPDNLWNFGYNVSIDLSNHTDIFDETITPAIAVMHNETGTDSFHDYTTEIQPGNSADVPFKSEGTTNGDTFIIGSPFKFDSIYLDVSTAASTDDFTWQFWNGAGWTTFTGSHQFVDGTNGGSNSLEQDGTISWDPSDTDMDNEWAFYNGGEDNVDNLPDTSGNDYYLIRVLCSDFNAPTPLIKSVSMKKYIRIRFDLDACLVFQTNDDDKKPIYYEIDHHNWANVIVDKYDDFWSVNDETPSIRLNFHERNAALMITMGDMRLYDYNGSQAGVLTRLDKTFEVDACVYNKIENYELLNYIVNETMIPANYSEDVDLDDLPLDKTFSVNVTDLDYVYIEITPRNAYDLTQINLQVINGTLNGINLVFPTEYDEYTIIDFISTHNNAIYDYSTLVELFESNDATYHNLTMEFGFVNNEKMYLELDISETDPADLTIIKINVGQYDYTVIEVDPPSSFPVWAIWTITIGGIALVVVGGLVLYKKKNPTAFMGMSKPRISLKRPKY